MISSDSRTISGLRRSRTPSAPVPNKKPATARYQATSGPSINPSLCASPRGSARVGAEDDATDRGDQQHDRRDLEREQMVGEEQSPHLGWAAEGATDVLRVRKPPARLQPDHDDDLDEERTRSQHRPDGLPARSACPRRL